MSRPYQSTPPLTEKMPGGVPYIVGNEAAERFSFYGMKTILLIFMTEYLVNRSGSPDVMTTPQATEYIHYFVGAAYAFSIPGAILSDTLLGKYRTIISLSLVYCLGHLALALDETRLGLFTGLTLIAVGAGGIKPCVSAHVGDQFGIRNKHLLSRVFQWFYFSINLGAFLSTLLTPLLLARFGPQVAFAVPGVLMLLATVVFWMGRHKFVHIPPSGMKSVRDAFTGNGLRAILYLTPIYLCVAMFWALFDQTGSSWIDQARRMDRQWLGITWYSSQIQAANPILILAFIPLFSYVIYPLIDRVIPLTPLRKIGIGFFVCVTAFAVPAWIESRITGGQIVSFKNSPDDDALLVAPEADKDFWSVENLIDGSADGTGWAAPVEIEDSQFRPRQVAIRLRQQRPWKIEAVELNPFTSPRHDTAPPDSQDMASRTWRIVTGLLTTQPKVKLTSAQLQRCAAKEVEVLVGNSRVGPWQSVGSLQLTPSDTLQRLSFPPVEAEYVKLRIQSNHGGDYVTLGEAAVIAAQRPPEMSQELSELWPNVAATGARPNIAWQLLAFVLITAAEIMISITCLEFSYTQAPPSLKSFIMSIYLLSVTVGNVFTGLVNRFIQNPDGSSKLEGASYFGFFTGVILATALCYLVVAKLYRGQTFIQGTKVAPADKSPPNE